MGRRHAPGGRRACPRCDLDVPAADGPRATASRRWRRGREPARPAYRTRRRSGRAEVAGMSRDATKSERPGPRAMWRPPMGLRAGVAAAALAWALLGIFGVFRYVQA